MQGVHGQIHTSPFFHKASRVAASSKRVKMMFLLSFQTQVCNHEMPGYNRSHCSKNFCECIYVISVPLNRIVELVIIDEAIVGDEPHPMHLHGYNFRVMAMHQVSKIKKINKNIFLKTSRKINKKKILIKNFFLKSLLRSHDK